MIMVTKAMQLGGGAFEMGEIGLAKGGDWKG